MNNFADAISRSLISAFIEGCISDDKERKKTLEYIRKMPSVLSSQTEDESENVYCSRELCARYECKDCPARQR